MVYGIGTDGIETTPNVVYGVSTDGIETTPNVVYGISTDGIETTPNVVYGVKTDGVAVEVQETLDQPYKIFFSYQNMIFPTHDCQRIGQISW